MLTPRFCSSKTRPNSFPIGSLISVPTALKPKARLCPERRTRAIISRASGSCVLKVFKRFLRRKRSQHMGSEPAAMPHSGTIAAGLFMATAAAQPASPRTAEKAARRPMVSVVSACSKSRLKLPNFWNQSASMPGASSKGRARTLLSLSMLSLPAGAATPVRISRRSSSRDACGWEKSIMAPPTRAATPMKARMPISSGFTPSPPT